MRYIGKPSMQHILRCVRQLWYLYESCCHRVIAMQWNIGMMVAKPLAITQAGWHRKMVLTIIGNEISHGQQHGAIFFAGDHPDTEWSERFYY